MTQTRNYMYDINYMYENFLKCGYSEPELLKAKMKALSLNRDDLLKNISRTAGDHITTDNEIVTPAPLITCPDPLVFVSMFSCYTAPLKVAVKKLKNEIKLLIGHDNIIFASKKNPKSQPLSYFVNPHLKFRVKFLICNN